MAGLNFCDEYEAKHFYDAVTEKIKRRHDLQEKNNKKTPDPMFSLQAPSHFLSS